VVFLRSFLMSPIIPDINFCSWAGLMPASLLTKSARMFGGMPMSSIIFVGLGLVAGVDELEGFLFSSASIILRL